MGALMRKALLGTLLAAAALPTTANATTTVWGGTGANDSISWGQLGSVGTSVMPGTSVTSTGGVNATVTDDTGGQMERLDQGNGWAGSFTSGTQLLWNEGSVGDIIINFLTPVSAAGALIQSDLYGSFTATATTNDGSTFSVNGISSDCACGSNPFLGIMSDSANISSIRFNVSDANGANDFAIGPLQLIGNVAGVPEPATWAMMLIGFGAVGWTVRRKRRPAASMQVV